MGAFEDQLLENETMESLIRLYSKSLAENKVLKEENKILKERGKNMLVKCQSILPNQMQCKNTAFAYIDSVPYCRLHLNIFLDKNIAYTAKITPVNEIDKADLTNLLSFVERLGGK
jgi:hypothetical protein